MLPNTPTTWLESNNPSLHQGQGDSVGCRQEIVPVWQVGFRLEIVPLSQDL